MLLKDLKNKFHVRKDECGDFYIDMRGNTKLEKSEIKNHIYLHDFETLGLMMRSVNTKQKLKNLNKKLEGISILEPHVICEGEFIALAKFKDIDTAEKIIAILGGRKRRRVNQETREKLSRQLKHARQQKKELHHVKGAVDEE